VRNWGMLDSIWRYPLKSAQGEAVTVGDPVRTAA
jgi:uncharacterized protein YcbX